MISPKMVLQKVQQESDTLASHYKTLEILEGNLEKYIKRSLSNILSPRVYAYAISRLVPINILPRYVDKLANIYQTGVIREVTDGTPADSDLLSYYEKTMDVNSAMAFATRMFIANKSTLLHPVGTNDGPMLRVIPNDRFVVYSTNPVDPLEPTGVILLAGKDAQNREVYVTYEKDSVLISKSDESIDYQAMEELGIGDGVNSFGVLPFVYVNSSNLRLSPYPDIDTQKMVEYIPTALTDLNLAALFASFSITHVTNGSVENLTYAPNAVWFLKSDDPEKDVQIGTLKPEVDYREVLDLIQTEMSLWLGSKGIKAGSVGQLAPENVASGVAKIIDEADTYEVRQKLMLEFTKAEGKLWDLILNKMHPVWIQQGYVTNRSIFSAGADVMTKFAMPMVGTQRAQVISDQREEFASGFTTRARAIAALNPHMTASEVGELIKQIDEERFGGSDVNQAPEDQSSTTGRFDTGSAGGSSGPDSREDSRED
jgi:hypothetical protein